MPKRSRAANHETIKALFLFRQAEECGVTNCRRPPCHQAVLRMITDKAAVVVD